MKVKSPLASTGSLLCLFLCLLACAIAPPPKDSREMGKRLASAIGEAGSLENRGALSPKEFYQGLGGRTGDILPFDLREVFQYEYAAPADNSPLTLQICVTGSPLDAFGLHRLLLPPEGAPRRAPETGSESRNGITFYQDIYVARIRPARPGAASAESYSLLADWVSRALPGRGRVPAEVRALSTLPVAATDMFYETGSMLGSSFLAPALAAKLPGDRGAGTAFITVTGSPREAQAAFEGYLMERARGRKGIAFTLGVGETACSVRDDDFGWINLAKTGRHLVGLSGLALPGDGWPTVNRMVNSLEE